MLSYLDIRAGNATDAIDVNGFFGSATMEIHHSNVSASYSAVFVSNSDAIDAQHVQIHDNVITHNVSSIQVGDSVHLREAGAIVYDNQIGGVTEGVVADAGSMLVLTGNTMNIPQMLDPQFGTAIRTTDAAIAIRDNIVFGPSSDPTTVSSQPRALVVTDSIRPRIPWRRLLTTCSHPG